MVQAFLMNHSKSYGIAVAASFVEYFVELLLFPSWKTWNLISVCGFLSVLAGQVRSMHNRLWIFVHVITPATMPRNKSDHPNARDADGGSQLHTFGR